MEKNIRELERAFEGIKHDLPWIESLGNHLRTIEEKIGELRPEIPTTFPVEEIDSELEFLKGRIGDSRKIRDAFTNLIRKGSDLLKELGK